MAPSEPMLLRRGDGSEATPAAARAVPDVRLQARVWVLGGWTNLESQWPIIWGYFVLILGYFGV